MSYELCRGKVNLQLSCSSMEETSTPETVLMEIKGEVNDMMSELPNCLLAFIISLLSIKDAVKTSILSRRWRHLFMLIPDLVVDSANIFSDDQDHRRFTLSSYEFFEKERREFVMRVDQIMMQLMRGRHIRSLTVGFFMDSEYSSHLDSWLKVAIASGLTKLELFLSLEQNFLTRFIVDEHRLYNFPYWLFSESNTSILSHLRLENCVLRTPGDFKGFKNLTTLELNDVVLAEGFATEILPSCLLLEQLTFLWCKLNSSLCFDNTSLSLKHLKVLQCYPDPIIKISSVNLTTFEYAGEMMKIAYLYAPQLKEMCSIDTWGPLSFVHFSRLPKLEILLLYVDYLQIQKIPRSLDSMANLKQLSLFLVSADDDFDLSWVISFLKAAPLLQKLVLTLHGGEKNADQKEIRKLDGVEHNQLKEFEIHGCAGNWYEIELQLFVLSRASRLKRLVISPSTSMYAGNGRWVDISEGVSRWSECCQEMVRNQLEGHVPQGVQLVFL